MGNRAAGRDFADTVTRALGVDKNSLKGANCNDLAPNAVGSLTPLIPCGSIRMVAACKSGVKTSFACHCLYFILRIFKYARKVMGGGGGGARVFVTLTRYQLVEEILSRDFYRNLCVGTRAPPCRKRKGKTQIQIVLSPCRDLNCSRVSS